MKTPGPDFLAHHEGDCVAVAVRDLAVGTAEGGYLDGPQVTVELLHDVPLGHKLALKDVEAGEDVVEYGIRIGVASKDIARGDYVHVHNVRSARWQTSIA
jgi:(2R)-sulfolactate sulfo-lyase subunit alpha